MNEPQVWTVIGVLAATLMGFLVAMVTMFSHTLTARLDELRSGIHSEMVELRSDLTRRIDGIEHRLDGVEHRLDGVERRIDGIDRDVQALVIRAARDDER
jgi:hypothetical protein